MMWISHFGYEVNLYVSNIKMRIKIFLAKIGRGENRFKINIQNLKLNSYNIIQTHIYSLRNCTHIYLVLTSN